jgi:hypothetical protein
MPLPNLRKLFQGSATELVKTIGGVIDNLNLSPEEKLQAQLAMEQAANSHAEKMAELAIHELEVEAANTASARDSNVKIQESEHASWLARNTAYILDFIITGVFVGAIAVVVWIIIPEDNKEIFYTLIGVLGAKFGDIINFHRGSSKGSEDKQKTIDRMRFK